MCRIMRPNVRVTSPRHPRWWRPSAGCSMMPAACGWVSSRSVSCSSPGRACASGVACARQCPHPRRCRCRRWRSRRGSASCRTSRGPTRAGPSVSSSRWLIAELGWAREAAVDARVAGDSPRGYAQFLVASAEGWSLGARARPGRSGNGVVRRPSGGSRSESGSGRCRQPLPRVLRNPAPAATGGHVEAPVLGQCLERVMLAIRFPAPKAGDVTVDYPLQFGP
jgi:hypothetical protein